MTITLSAAEITFLEASAPSRNPGTLPHWQMATETGNCSFGADDIGTTLGIPFSIPRKLGIQLLALKRQSLKRRHPSKQACGVVVVVEDAQFKDPTKEQFLRNRNAPNGSDPSELNLSDIRGFAKIRGHMC